MTAFSVSTDARVARTVRVRLRGEADMAVRDLLLKVLLDACGADGAHEVVVDLAKVTFLDAAVVGALLIARNAAERRGRRLRVDRASGVALQVLEVTGVAGVLGAKHDGWRPDWTGW